MRRLLLVANPSASGFAASTHREVVEILSESYEVEPSWPTGPDEARSHARNAAGQADVVVAMGGDGVVHQVANAIVGTDSALGVLAVGTTNVVSRLLGMPKKLREAAAAIAATDRTRSIPVLEIQRDEHPAVVAVFAAGIGFDADVIAESEKRPDRKLGLGALHYGRSALRVSRRYRTRLATLRVTAGELSADAVGVQVQVHDDFTFLGPIPLRLGPGPGPVAAVISDAGPWRLARTVVRAAAHRDLSKVSGIEVWSGWDRIEVEAEPAALMEADGEVLGTASRAVLRPSDRMLKVLDVAAGGRRRV
jgi:diacylglycerol kinase family enzyme